VIQISRRKFPSISRNIRQRVNFVERTKFQADTTRGTGCIAGDAQSGRDIKASMDGKVLRDKYCNVA